MGRSLRCTPGYLRDMVRKQKLKVYRTPIGFHDAYVAATSQKAALKAWGSDADLFARGIAEVVTDEALTREPLAKPGIVIRKPRGTSAEFVAALPKDRPAASRDRPPVKEDLGPPPRARTRPAPTKPAPRTTRSSAESATQPAEHKPVRKSRKAPRPDRAKLEEAEQAVKRADADHTRRIAEVREKEKQLQRERRELEKRHDSEMAKLQKSLDKARDSYAAALRKWRG